jgi:hypothetical protein
VYDHNWINVQKGPMTKCSIVLDYFKGIQMNVIFVCGYGCGKKRVLEKVTAQGKLGSEKLIVYQQ